MINNELYRLTKEYYKDNLFRERFYLWIKELTSRSRVLSKEKKSFDWDTTPWVTNLFNSEYFSSVMQDFFTTTGEVEVGRKLNEYFIINPASIRAIYDYIRLKGGQLPYFEKSKTKKSLKKNMKLIYILSFLSQEQLKDYLKSHKVSEEEFLWAVKGTYQDACCFLWGGGGPTGIVENRIEGALFFLKRKLGADEPMPNYLKYLFFGVGIQISPYYEEVRHFYLAELLELLEREPDLLKDILPVPDSEYVYSITRQIDNNAIIDTERFLEALELIKKEKIKSDPPLYIVKEYWPLEVVALTIHGIVNPIYRPFAEYVVKEIKKNAKKDFNTPPYLFDDTDNYRVLTLCENLFKKINRVTKVVPLKMDRKVKPVL